MDMTLISDKLKQVLHDLEIVTTMFENMHAAQQAATNDDFLTRNATSPAREE